jgi:hypothetical protein
MLRRQRVAHRKSGVLMKRMFAIGLGAVAMAAGLACQDESAGRPAARTAGNAPAAVAQADASAPAAAGGAPAAAAPVQPAKDEAGVRSIELPAVALDLPPGPGRDTVTGACAFCHSNRYITLQPRFTRQQWTAEVDKMRKTYGAPLTDPQATEAVEYLVSVRGTDAATTKPTK